MHEYATTCMYKCNVLTIHGIYLIVNYNNLTCSLQFMRLLKKKDECMKVICAHTAKYLEACNLILENGILSHKMICSPESKVLVNISKGMQWFFKWKELQKEPGKIMLLLSSLMGDGGDQGYHVVEIFKGPHFYWEGIWNL